MKFFRTLMFVVVVLAVSLSAALAAVPPINGGNTNTCSGITINAIPGANNTFTYSITVDRAATFNSDFIVAVADLYVYPASPVQPSNIGVIAANWVPVPFDAGAGGFGFESLPPQAVNGALRTETMVIGTASFASIPATQSFQIRTITCKGSGICSFNSNVVPEPGSLALLAVGMVPALGMIRRRPSHARHS